MWLAGLTAYPLTESTEGRYASVAWDMAHGGSWITPTYNGAALFTKPPLAYWAGAGALKVLPDAAWAVRLPATLALLLGAFFTLRLGLLFGLDRNRAGWVFLLAALSPLAMIQGHMTTGDIFLWVGILMAYLGLLAEAPGWKLRLLTGLGLAVGFMAKGHMVLFWVVIPLAAWAITRSGNARPLLRLLHPLTLLVFVGLAAPWFAAALHKHPDLMGYWLGDETAGRVLSTRHGRAEPWWYFLPQVPLLMLPWLPELVRGVRRIRWRGAGSSRSLLLVLWIAVPLVVFSLSGSKRPNYLLPMVTPLALLAAQGIPEVAGRFLRGRTAAWMIIVLAWPFVMGGFHLGPPTRNLVRRAHREGAALACYRLMPTSIVFYHRGALEEFDFGRDDRFGGEAVEPALQIADAQNLLDQGGMILTTANQVSALGDWTGRPLLVVADIQGKVLVKSATALPREMDRP